jgi:hypothetical protein
MKNVLTSRTALLAGLVLANALLALASNTAAAEVWGICKSPPGSSPPYPCTCEFEIAYDCTITEDCCTRYPMLCGN